MKEQQNKILALPDNLPIMYDYYVRITMHGQHNKEQKRRLIH